MTLTITSVAHVAEPQRKKLTKLSAQGPSETKGSFCYNTYSYQKGGVLMSALRNKIRGEILAMPYPFCMLSEMYEEGVVYYDEVDKPSSDPNASKFVFYTAQL